MGRFIQEILQGRSKQKGDGNRIIRFLLPVSLLISYTTVVLEPSPKWVLPWFCFLFIISATYSFLWFVRKLKKLALETCLSYGLLISGVIQFFNLKELHIIYIPYIFSLSLLFRPGIVIPLSLAVPFLELRHFINGDTIEEVLLSLIIVLIGSVLSIFLTYLKRQRDDYRKTLERIKAEASDIGGAPNEEGLLSQHLSIKEETDEEIKNLLDILRRILLSEAAGFFSSGHGDYGLRCSVPEKGLKGLEDYIIKEFVGKGSEPFMSYSASIITCPVRDGNSTIGFIVARSGKGKFNPSDIEIMRLFSEQISMIIRKERINKVIKRDQFGLKLLNEGSSRLNSSLEMKTLSSRMIEAMYKVAPVKILLFIRDLSTSSTQAEKVSGRSVRFELIYYLGIVDPDNRVFDLKDTMVGNYSEGREPVYLSDLSGNKTPVLPFRIGDVGSMLVLPLLYEKKHLGLLLFLSERVNAISSYQINLLRILANQASTALANARLYAKIERMAITDGLTGLYNHRHFQERLSSEFGRVSRHFINLSLLLIDIDHFKKINDTYGHPAGDDVLRAVAGVIRETIRNIDVPARYGGEEFAVLLPDTDNTGAIKMAERLRSSISNRRFSFDGREIAVTVSIGTATAPLDARTREELIGRADEALYKAKEMGRNRCISWGQV